MSSSDQNLSKVSSGELPSGEGLKIGIAVSDWNKEVTAKLLIACKKVFTEQGVKEDDIKILNTPGAFELPFAAKLLVKNTNPDAIVCLGCVIKGETKHDVYINSSVAQGITGLSLASDIPIIFGVLTVNNMEQALARSGGKYGNKGEESAHTALKMVALKKSFNKSKKKIGY